MVNRNRWFLNLPDGVLIFCANFAALREKSWASKLNKIYIVRKGFHFLHKAVKR